MLKKKGIEVSIFSDFKFNISQLNIIKHLNILYYEFNCKNKLERVEEWIYKINNIYKNLQNPITLENIAFMGDDLNNLELIKNVGISGCPLDATEECLKNCDFISTKRGGNGCVREFCEYLIKGEFEKINSKYKLCY